MTSKGMLEIQRFYWRPREYPDEFQALQYAMDDLLALVQHPFEGVRASYEAMYEDPAVWGAITRAAEAVKALEETYPK